MAQQNDIRFLLNGEEKTVTEVKATLTLLDYLRLEQRLTGTKEGCAEGDCGACTVLVGRLHQGQLRYETVNACIRFLASLNGCHIVTVEHLSGPMGRLHPVQQAMVEYHGSQCGFCTPGFVMSLYALWMGNPEPSVQEVETAIQGNLCRCTGYEPIVKAAMAVTQYGSPAHDHLTRERNDVTARLMALQPKSRIETGPEDDRAILPVDVADLAKVLDENPKATIVAGSTDVGLWVTKFMRPISPVVFITHLEGLKSIDLNDDALTIGAGVCQDHTHVLIAASRAMGCPARYVVGYLLPDSDEDDVEIPAETHAWAELWIDGLGWVGFDATNRICPTDRYVRLASGFDANDAAPIHGAVFGSVEEAMEAEVAVSAITQSQQQSQS